MANCSEEELHVDGKTVADIMAKYTERLKYLEHMKVIELLWNKKVIDHEEYVSIQKTENMDRRLFLQEKLPKKGDTAFQKFLECLNEINQKILAKEMRRDCMDNQEEDTRSAFKQLEKEKDLETRNKEMEKELALEKRQKVELESRIRKLEEEPKKLVHEETEREKRKLAKDLKENKEIEELRLELSNVRTMEMKAKDLEKQLEESRYEVEKLQLELRTLKKKAKDLEEQLKEEQNANRGIVRDKRTHFSNVLRYMANSKSYWIDILTADHGVTKKYFTVGYR
ncbi:unnamed protein product [Darwinula stevensoni]|uniref:CARD domain-containing protein n=1 Tax=Darwinula stevensoni TaxID=69355 RepID=A0A7R9FQV7_9CRUS|nr:unnamed protein product [Darwinula stevensoni]CAG0899884.1 unnamed protein product [Darwinula stevensoni]